MSAIPNSVVSLDVIKLCGQPDATFLPTEPLPKARRAQGMTHPKMCARIKAGHGIGHGSKYLPWLTLGRKNCSPVSNQVVSRMPPLGRTTHFFSRGEYHTALLLLWLGVNDLREQFPLWPVPHPHPLEGATRDASIQLPWSRGLLAIANDANIKHGVEFGTTLPYVASMDLMATVHLSDRTILAAFSSKPFSDPASEIKWRTRERLELERRYMKEIDGRYFVSSSALIPTEMAARLEFCLDAYSLHRAPNLIPLITPFSEHVSALPERPLNEAVICTATKLSISLDHAWILFRHCVWTQAIDVDPTVKILTSFPIRAGGRQLRDHLRRCLFGESWT